MDKLQPYIEGFKKYHFWLLCVVILAAAFFAWRSGTGTLDEQFQANKSQIEGAFSQAEGVGRTRPHPNDRYITEKDEAYDKLVAELTAAWQLHYDRQQAIFVWPTKEALPNLMDSFHDTVSKLGKNDEIPREFISNYREEIRNIPALWPAKYNLRRVASGSGKDAVLEGVLVWNGISALEQRYRFGRPQTTTKHIRIAQEDLWVYEALLAAVNRLNEGHTRHHEAVVKQIVALNIGQQALLDPLPTLPTVTSGAGADANKEIKVAPADAEVEAELVAFRYCDPTGKPLPAPSGKEEYLLMPVHLVVVMDQRRVPDLLLSLANSPLLFDTTLLSFTDGDVMDLDKQKLPGAGGAAAPAGGGAKNPAAAEVEAEVGPFDAKIDIRGFIYLFNPPDTERLKPKGKAGGPDVAAAGRGNADSADN